MENTATPPEGETSMEHTLTAWAREAFAAAFPDADLSQANLGVVATADSSFGDYQCNAAMGLAKVLRMAPRTIAEAAVAAAPTLDAVGRVEIAGPGFINLHLSDAWLETGLAAMAQDDRLLVPRPGAGRTVVLDYSSPNVAKQMHIGHTRSTVIGNALDRLHRFLGYHVISDNHLGDWGTQFGILILGYRNFLDQAALERAPVDELERLYVESMKRAKKDPEWMEAARGELVKLQQGDPENRALWEKFLELSLNEFDAIYQRLGVSFDLHRGESHYRGQLEPLVQRLEQDGIAEHSEGATVVFPEGKDAEKPPVCIVRKSDGGFNYATSDLATIESRIEEFEPEAIIYVTDERQQAHFRQVFAVARLMGVTTRLEHVWFGLMRLPEGTFSTRDGNVIKLHLMLDEAERRALQLLQEGSPDMPEEKQKEVARAIGIGAVKYADLSQNPQSLVTFSWDKALALDGNSAPYLQYAYARIASVRDKFEERFPGVDPDTFAMRLGEPVERDLAVRLVRFPDTVMRACAMYRPNLLADYLFDLAQVYSSFYQNVPFLKADEGVRESRVRLCGLVSRVLRQGLDLLGIETPERI